METEKVALPSTSTANEPGTSSEKKVLMKKDEDTVEIQGLDESDEKEPLASNEGGPKESKGKKSKAPKEKVPKAPKEKVPKATKEKGSSSNRKYMKRTTLTILLGILNVFLLAILIFIIAFFVKDKSQRVIINPSRTFCLPCEEISLHPDDDPINFKYFAQRRENGKDICCADDGYYLDKMMALYVERKHAIKAAESNKKELEAACNKDVAEFEPRVMARVAGVQSTVPNGINHVVQWQTSGVMSNLLFKHNITYDSNSHEFVIIKPGYYYIYSQVTMEIDAATQSHGDSVYHYLYRTRGVYPVPLLENSRTRCRFQGNKSTSTSYIGAVFNLEKDDKLMIKVSHPNILEKFNPSSSYFGLHII